MTCPVHFDPIMKGDDIQVLIPERWIAQAETLEL